VAPDRGQGVPRSRKAGPHERLAILPLARWLAVLGKDMASGMALERYRQLMPQDQGAKMNRDELPRKEMADVGITCRL